MKIVLSGAIGVGKSSVTRLVMARLGLKDAKGFSTFKERSSIVMERWIGEREICGSSRRRGPEPILEVFDEFGSESLNTPADSEFAIIDELGRMELPAQRFRAATAALFRRQAHVLVVIQQRALAEWTRIIGLERINHIFVLDKENRDALPGSLVNLFGARGQS